MTRKRSITLAAAAMAVAAGLGTGVALAAGGGAPGPAGQAARTLTASPAASPGPGYPWYRSMMDGYYGQGTMMGGGAAPGWMMSQAGYQWMAGGASAPGWMRGGTLPGAMMGANGSDPATIMGRLFAGAPGPRISPAQAARLGGQAPAGAAIDRARRTITFTSHDVRLVVLASPSMPAESFRIAGMTNPAITVPAGAAVRITVINADTDMAHGLVVTATGAAGSPMPMMTAGPAFSGAALWFLGEPTAAGMHEGALAFTARTAGDYQYLCPVTRHAQEGMAGTFTVR